MPGILLFLIAISEAIGSTQTNLHHQNLQIISEVVESIRANIHHLTLRVISRSKKVSHCTFQQLQNLE